MKLRDYQRAAHDAFLAAWGVDGSRGRELATLQAKLAEIRARAEKATPGPWEVRKAGVVLDPSTLPTRNIAFKLTYASGEDRDFIARSRTDIPALLSVVERMAEAVEGYAECGDGCTCGDGWGHETAISSLAEVERIINQPNQNQP